MDKNVHIFLIAMLDACDNAEKFLVAITLESFLSDDLRIAAIERELELVGQAFKDAMTQDVDIGQKIDALYPWHQIIWLRNVLAHEYNAINNEQLYSTVKNDIPILQKLLRKYLKK